MIPTLQLGQFGRRIKTSGGGQQYWDPATRDSFRIALSGTGNKIATRQAVNINAWYSVRAVDSRSTGKLYFEIENTVDSGGATMMGGLATSALSQTSYPGSSTTSFGFHANATGSETYTNGVASNAGGTKVASGSYMRVAVDLDNGRVWLGNPTSWEGGGDPATNTTPTYTYTPPLTLFPALGQFSTTQQNTLRILSTEFSGAIPSGFSAWS